MKKIVSLGTLTFTLSLVNFSVAAADIEKGKALSGQCAACHGPEGISPSPMWPNLAGQKAAYLEKQLKDFRADVRKDPMMGMMAKPLSDEDIANLAAYFASLK